MCSDTYIPCGGFRGLKQTVAAAVVSAEPDLQHCQHCALQLRGAWRASHGWKGRAFGGVKISITLGHACLNWSHCSETQVNVLCSGSCPVGGAVLDVKSLKAKLVSCCAWRCRSLKNSIAWVCASQRHSAQRLLVFHGGVRSLCGKQCAAMPRISLRPSAAVRPYAAGWRPCGEALLSRAGRRQGAPSSRARRPGAERCSAGPWRPVPCRGPSVCRRALRSSTRAASARGCGGRLRLSSSVPDPHAFNPSVSAETGTFVYAGCVNLRIAYILLHILFLFLVLNTFACSASGFSSGIPSCCRNSTLQR